jgi:hypothetical protein
MSGPIYPNLPFPIPFPMRKVTLPVFPIASHTRGERAHCPTIRYRLGYPVTLRISWYNGCSRRYIFW